MPKKGVNAKEVRTDIEAGMPNTALIKKHGLKRIELQNLVKKGGGCGGRNNFELDEQRISLQQKTRDPVTHKDLSEEGWIPNERHRSACRGRKGFLVYLKEVRKKVVRLRAACAWTKRDVDARLLQEAGFKTVEISDSDLLEKLRAARHFGLRDPNLSRKR
jgi:hypothetical protein